MIYHPTEKSYHLPMQSQLKYVLSSWSWGKAINLEILCRTSLSLFLWWVREPTQGTIFGPSSQLTWKFFFFFFFFLPFTHKACCLAHRLRTQNFIPMYCSMFWLLLDHSDIYIILKFSYYLKHCSSHSTCSRDKGFIEKWTYAIISIGRFYFLIVTINMLHS